ncbi:MAG TPA: hypothetical protein VGP04_23275 [Pseudonocardiaceae bacterium]|nr:hypothetical protein [Pseudonocardiaceae bacterium]
MKILAAQYEGLRRDSPAGPERTSAMTRIVNEARVRAASSLGTAARKAPKLLRSPSEGDRIIGLAFTQESGDPAVLDDVLNLVKYSASAFEMFHALLAVEEMAFKLTSDQRATAMSVLAAEQRDPRGVGISADLGLPALIARTLAELSMAST